jgi:glucose-6-phosphate 1-epimerase
MDFHGMPAIAWQSRDGARAIATLQGAQVVSWIPAGGAECLYVSERSPFEAGRPIRGGIPVVFPQFADRGPLAQHGFARTCAWTFTGVEEAAEGTRARFVLESSPETRALWPGAFQLVLTARIGGPRLDVELQVVNVGQQPFAFNAALHTYLRVSEAAAARLQGLRGARYAVRGEAGSGVEARELVTFDEPIDRAYLGTGSVTHLEAPERVFRIAQRGFVDTVVWNPGRERTARMADMPPEGYRHMVCVEAARFEHPVRLETGGSWSGAQSIEVRDASG